MSLSATLALWPLSITNPPAPLWRAAMESTENTFLSSTAGQTQNSLLPKFASLIVKENVLAFRPQDHILGLLSMLYGLKIVGVTKCGIKLTQSNIPHCRSKLKTLKAIFHSTFYAPPTVLENRTLLNTLHVSPLLNREEKLCVKTDPVVFMDRKSSRRCLSLLLNL